MKPFGRFSIVLVISLLSTVSAFRHYSRRVRRQLASVARSRRFGSFHREKLADGMECNEKH